MSRIRLGSDLVYKVNTPTSFLLHLAVAQNTHQRIVREKSRVPDGFELEHCQVGELGNRLYRLAAKPGEFRIAYRAEVELTHDEVKATDVGESRHVDLPADVLTFLNPSRYCESDRLYRFASEEFAAVEPGLPRVAAICDWVHDKLAYVGGSTGPTTTACDVLLQRAGVCRDFAHVGISLCRAMGIPARYVSGYAVDLAPPDFHGFFEAFLDGKWFLFDPSKLAPVRGFVRIGTGRDAADVAFATLTGNSVLSNKQVWASFVDGPPDVTEETAVSTA